MEAIYSLDVLTDHERKIKSYMEKHKLDSLKVYHMGNEYKVLKDSFTIPIDFDKLERPCPKPDCKSRFCLFKTKELRSMV
jgi:hypothetical protein